MAVALRASRPARAVRAAGAPPAVDGVIPSVASAMMDVVAANRSSRSPFVGRSAELQQLTTLLAADSPDHAVLLSGDAGVGKSRLLRELVGRAAQDNPGGLVLVGHCLDLDDGALPYLPFSDAFGRVARDHPDVAQRLVAVAPAVSRLLPARRMLNADAPTPAPAPDLPVDRQALYDGVSAALSELAAERPALLVIEDAHWADESTRHLLSFLLSRPSDQPLRIVVSYRSEDLHRRHPLRATAAEWARLPGVARLNLAPLTAPDVRTLVHNLHEGPITEQNMQAILDRAEGNAFFTEELVSAFDHVDGVPGDLADLLLVRIERLSDQARRVVRAVSVAGRRVSHALLSAVVELADGELDTAVRSAVEASVLIPRGDADYAFRHALLAEAVYEDLLPGERVRLHAAYAAVLAAGRVPGTAAELARHARLSQDNPTALGASIRAGDEAMAVAAPWEAMRHYEEALSLWPSVHGSGEPVEHAGLTVTAAEAMFAAGYAHRAAMLLESTLSTLPGSTSTAVRLQLLHEAATTELAIGEDDRAGANAQEALTLSEAQPGTEARARSLALRARTAVAVGDDETAAEAAEEALELARELGIPETEASARESLARIGQRAGDDQAAERSLRKAIERAAGGGTRTVNAEMRSRMTLAFLYYDDGRLDDAAGELRIVVAAGDKAGMPWSVHPLDARVLLAMLEYNRGNWDAAAEVASVVGETPTSFAEASLAAAASLVRAGRGDRTLLGILPAVRKWWDKDPMLGMNVASPAIEVLGQSGEPVAAMDLHDEIVEVISTRWGNALFLGRIRLAATLAAVVADAAAGWSGEEREIAVRRLRPAVELARQAAATRTGPDAMRRLGPEGVAWLDRLEAEWSRARWQAAVDPPTEDDLVAAWTTAVASADAINGYEAARGRARLAAALQAANRSDEAQPLADAAREVARGLQAAPLLAELRELGTAPSARPSSPETLTAREREVLTLVAAGRTNRQIGTALFISDKTASVHVSNILAKLAAGSRTEAAAIARRDGLID